MLADVETKEKKGFGPPPAAGAAAPDDVVVENDNGPVVVSDVVGGAVGNENDDEEGMTPVSGGVDTGPGAAVLAAVEPKVKAG
jgi:hypothetical protein